MSHAVFLDTSGWLAVVATREARHREVLAAYRKVLDEGRLVVTTNLVVAEMHILLTRRRGAGVALELLDVLRNDPTHEIVHADEATWRDAVDRWLRRYADHDFSLTDAISFETMRRRRITQAIALDAHFRLAGFETLPE